MKKIIKTGLAVLLCALLLLPVYGCSDDSTTPIDPTPTPTPGGTTTKPSVSQAVLYDTENRAFTMSIGAIDGNFNPFFYTAANDGIVTSMTQASMLASDNAGNIVCGEDYPTVVKDYTMVSYNANGQEVSSGSASSSNTAYTEYSFLIKNGMKFSDGEDLTIMDVLFSLYVNIDIAYTGSATLYSNDIQGLNAYREQDPSLDDDSTNSSAAKFNAEAQQRLTNIVNYCNGGTVSDVNQVLKDIETVKELFREELSSDWTSVSDAFSSRDMDNYEYTFEETWQAYYLNEGVIQILTETNANGATVQQKDENGKYLTSLDDPNEPYTAEIDKAKEDAAAIKIYTDLGYDYKNAVDCVVRDFCIDYVWEAMTGGYTSAKTNKSTIAEICQYWATASTALAQFAGEARTAYYEALKEANQGKLAVETVSGITVERTESFNGESLDGAYDVLKIRINGVDPKAIWNFAFAVCPLHYYSGTFKDKDYVKAAQDDYAAYVAAYEKGTAYTLTEFGVECGNSDFFNDILADTAKNGCPVGAGAYKASTANGGNGASGTFYTNKYVYYERNEYFETMGENIHNAFIKSVRYKEMGDNDVLTALLNQEIDYGTPSATVSNLLQLSQASYLDSSTLYDTNGYGYVGVNPKYVPDVEIRQAIMKAINTSAPTVNYFSDSYSSVIYRPMSKVSWAYPEDCSEYPSIAYTTNVAEIEALVKSAGYYKNSSGIYTNGTTTCKFTFTIAGSTSDHPAYQMFTEAEKILEQAGFDITVQTDTNALNKLASGQLAVWAAAWSSTVDPDMYQIYHKDSTASSVKNWNYSEILANPTNWSYEYDIIVELSDIIDKARETNNQDNRKAYYAEALDLVMDLAVELPTYQRKDNEVFNTTYISASSLNQTPTCYSSLIDRIWEVDYN